MKKQRKEALTRIRPRPNPLTDATRGVAGGGNQGLDQNLSGEAVCLEPLNQERGVSLWLLARNPVAPSSRAKQGVCEGANPAGTSEHTATCAPACVCFLAGEWPNARQRSDTSVFLLLRSPSPSLAIAIKSNRYLSVCVLLLCCLLGCSEQSGAIYIFTRSGTTWTQQVYLKASNTDADDRFGGDVALSGNTLAVGAHTEDGNAVGINGNQADNSSADSGAVYVRKIAP